MTAGDGDAQRSQLLTAMADAVSECRTAADQAAELNETGKVGLLRLAEIWCAIRPQDAWRQVLEGRGAELLADVVAQFYAYLTGCLYTPRGNGHLCRAALHDGLPHAGGMV